MYSKFISHLKSRIAQKKSNFADAMSTIGTYPRTMRLIWDSSHSYTINYLLTIILAAVMPPAQIWLFKLLIDRIIQSIQNPAQLINSHIILLLSIMSIVWIIERVVESLSIIVREGFGQKVMAHIDQLVLRKSTSLDLAFYETPKYYDILKNASQMGNRPGMLMMSMGTLLQQVITLVTYLVMLYYLHPLTIAIILVFTLPYLLSMAYFTKSRFQMMYRRTPESRMYGYLSNSLGSQEWAKEVRLFGFHKILIDRCFTYFNKWIKENYQISKSQGIYQGLLSMVSIAGTAGVWYYAAIQTVAQNITLGSLTLYFQAADQSRRSLIYLFFSWGHFYEASLYLKVLFNFLDLDSESAERTLRKPKSSVPLIFPKPVSQGIEFQNVSFQYPGSDRYVLQNLSFSLLPGQRVAIVGRNGAGKTTIVKLLSRLYDPTGGKIFIDGIDMAEYDLDDLRSQLGVIFQDFIRFNFSVQDNIGFGQIDRLHDLERIKSSAELAGCSSLIERLPNGYATVLGKVLEEGVDLSGGEWQKIALSRAFMRDAQILILDEPTAALDPQAEEELFQRFNELTSDKTSILISHRFSTVRSADRILVIDDGRLVEDGSHDELLRLNGVYSGMYTVQAARYG